MTELTIWEVTSPVVIREVTGETFTNQRRLNEHEGIVLASDVTVLQQCLADAVQVWTQERERDTRVIDERQEAIGHWQAEAHRLEAQLQAATQERDKWKTRYDYIHGQEVCELVVQWNRLEAQLQARDAMIAELHEDLDAYKIERKNGGEALSLPDRLCVALERMEQAEDERTWPSYQEQQATITRLEGALDKICEALVVADPRVACTYIERICETQHALKEAP